jgi:hypothetical protein
MPRFRAPGLRWPLVAAAPLVRQRLPQKAALLQLTEHPAGELNDHAGQSPVGLDEISMSMFIRTVCLIARL